jgi:hypothetical protein
MSDKSSQNEYAVKPYPTGQCAEAQETAQAVLFLIFRGSSSCKALPEAEVRFNFGVKAKRLSYKCLSLIDFWRWGKAPPPKINFFCVL